MLLPRRQLAYRVMASDGYVRVAEGRIDRQRRGRCECAWTSVLHFRVWRGNCCSEYYKVFPETHTEATSGMDHMAAFPVNNLSQLELLCFISSCLAGQQTWENPITPNFVTEQSGGPTRECGARPKTE